MERANIETDAAIFYSVGSNDYQVLDTSRNVIALDNSTELVSEKEFAVYKSAEKAMKQAAVQTRSGADDGLNYSDLDGWSVVSDSYEGIDSAKWAVFSDEDLVNKWMEFLSTIEVRRVDNAGRGQQEQNGGNFVVEIDTETEEYCLVFKSTDAIMQLEVNDADYDVKMPEDFPFEETYNKAIERYGVKGPWD